MMHLSCMKLNQDFEWCHTFFFSFYKLYLCTFALINWIIPLHFGALYGLLFQFQNICISSSSWYVVFLLFFAFIGNSHWHVSKYKVCDSTRGTSSHPHDFVIFISSNIPPFGKNMFLEDYFLLWCLKWLIASWTLIIPYSYFFRGDKKQMMKRKGGGGRGNQHKNQESSDPPVGPAEFWSWGWHQDWPLTHLPLLTLIWTQRCCRLPCYLWTLSHPHWPQSSFPLHPVHYWGWSPHSHRLSLWQPCWLTMRGCLLSTEPVAVTTNMSHPDCLLPLVISPIHFLNQVHTGQSEVAGVDSDWRVVAFQWMKVLWLYWWKLQQEGTRPSQLISALSQYMELYKEQHELTSVILTGRNSLSASVFGPVQTEACFIY